MPQYSYNRSGYISKEENVYMRLYIYTLNVYFCKLDTNESEYLKRKSGNSHNILYIPKSISLYLPLTCLPADSLHTFNINPNPKKASLLIFYSLTNPFYQYKYPVERN